MEKSRLRHGLAAIAVLAVLAAGTPSSAASWLRVYDGAAGFEHYAVVAGTIDLSFNDQTPPAEGQGIILTLDAAGGVLAQRGLSGGPFDESGWVMALDPASGREAWGYSWGVLQITAQLDFDPASPITYHHLIPEELFDVKAILAQPDGGALLLGRSWFGATNAWLGRVDSTGAILWQKALGAANEYPIAMARAPGDGAYVSIAPYGGGIAWVARFAADGTRLWSRRIEAPARHALPTALASTRDGGVAVAGASRDGAACCAGSAFFIRLDGAGTRFSSLELASPARSDTLEGVVETAAGDFLVHGQSIGTSVALLLNPAPSVRWQKRFPDMEVARAFEGPAGGIHLAGATVGIAPDRTGFLARLADDGTLATCVRTLDADLAPIAESLQIVDAALSESPVFVYTEGPRLSAGVLPTAARTLCADDCLFPPAAPVQRLLGWRDVGDARFTWDPDPAANGYNLWHVATKTDIDRARLGSTPPATAVPGCAEPTPATTTECRHAGAIAASPALLFYQVRAWCTTGREGP